MNRLILSSILDTEQSNIRKIRHKDNVIEVILWDSGDTVMITTQQYQATKQNKSLMRQLNTRELKKSNLSSQQVIGSLLAIAGVFMLVVALNMDTTVSSSIGRVNNIGLMQQQNQMAIFGGIALLTGIVLYVTEKK